MSSPQLENGYTRIANELMEQFALVNLSGREWQILLVILRKTYGFNKKDDKISLSQFEEATHIKSSDVSRVIKQLENKNIIGVLRNQWLNSYWLNKQWLNWLKPVAKQPIKPVAKQPHTKEIKKYTKEITPNGDKLKPMNYEQIIELDENGEELIKPIQRTTFGKYPAFIAKFYCELVGKTSASRQLPASKELLQLAQKDCPNDTLKDWAKEIKNRIKVAHKYYAMNNITDWNLSKVAENWEKIIQWSSKLK